MMRRMDDLRLGACCRAFRRRLGWRQSDLAARVGVHQTTISRIERGVLAGVDVGLLRRAFAALGARFEPDIWFRGGDRDKLLDEEHAEIGETVTPVYAGFGFENLPEVTFQHFGDRGSIDLLSLFPARRVVVVNEIKSDIHSVEETLRRHDVKVRAAARIVEERFGWRPRIVARVLIVPENMTARRHIDAHRALFDARYPKRSRDLLQWLRDPEGPMAAIWFLSRKRPAHVRRVRRGRTRVVPAGSRTRRAKQPVAEAVSPTEQAPDA
jgi:transcriptional regulator with XRE-family HTH domain